MLRARTWIFLLLLLVAVWMPPACDLEGDVGTWSRLSPADDLRAVGAGGGTLYAVGEGGAVLKSESPWRRLKAPLGANLSAVAVLGLGSAVAVGAEGAVLVTNDGGATWTKAEDPNLAGVRLAGVAAAQGVVAVVGEGGFIATSRLPAAPGSWTRRYGGSGEHLNAVAAAAGVLVAVGDEGTLLVSRDAGRTWGCNPDPSLAGLRLAGVAASRGGGLLAVVGEGGLVATSGDPSGNWTPRPSGTGRCLRGVCVAEGGLIYAVGERGTIVFSPDAGRTWQELPSGTRRNLNGITCDLGLLAVVGEGILLASEGPSAPGELPVFAQALPGFLAVHGSGEGNVWVVGEGGAVLAGASGALSFQTPPPLDPFESLSAVWAGKERVWVATDQGRVFSRGLREGVWSRELSGGVCALAGCPEGAGAEARPCLYGATEDGRVLSRNPDTGDWTAEPGTAELSFGRPLRSVWATGDDPATRRDESLTVAVGDRFTLLYQAGGAPWRRLDLSPDERASLGVAGTEHLEAVSGCGNVVFISGAGSGYALLLRLDLSRPESPGLRGARLFPESGRGLGLRGLWAAGPDLALAVGTQGALYRYDGRAWRREELPGNEEPFSEGLCGVWGTGPEEVYIVGERGAMYRYH